MSRIENNKIKKKLVVKKHNDRLLEEQKCSFKLATHSLLSVIIIKLTNVKEKTYTDQLQERIDRGQQLKKTYTDQLQERIDRGQQL